VTDTGASMPTIQFSGSGQISTTLGWSGDVSAPFTVSTWIKAPVADRTNSQGSVTCPGYSDGYRYYKSTDMWNASYTVAQAWLPEGCLKVVPAPANSNTPNYYYAINGVWVYRNATAQSVQPSTEPQTIFSTRKTTGFASTDLGLRLTNDYKCQIEGTGATFDCSKLSDGNFHNLVLRRDYYKKLELFIDGISMGFFRDVNLTFPRSFYIGR
jgi:hypothetical protein